MAKPILKWPGGKRQLLNELSARCPTNFNRYHEPFFGGGALFFELEPNNATINDANPRLMNVYQQVRDNPDDVIQLLKSYRHPKEPPDPERSFCDETRKGDSIDIYYYQQRELFNRRPNNEEFEEIEEAAIFLYLNRTCYNGLYRENQNGEFNASVGSYEDPNWVQEELLQKASEVLKGTPIQIGDYSYIVEEAEEGDFVYFDPPYSQTSNHAYTDGRFGNSKEQNNLIDIATSLVDSGVDVMLSNSGDMYEAYVDSGFHVIDTKADRVISNDGSNRGQSFNEVIATTVPPSEWEGGRQTTLTTFDGE